MKNTKRFFITGVSSGFGRAIANAALKAGHRVIGTVRTEQAAAEFEAQIRGEAHVKLLDVTQFDSVAPLAAIVEAAGGSIGSLVKVTFFIADWSDFPALNAVCAEEFKEPFPARSTLQNTRPMGALVGADAIAVLE